MQTAITLGGHRALWTFPGSAPLTSWLGARPWIGDGGLALLRTEGTAAVDFLTEALSVAAHGADAGASSLRIVPLELPLEPSFTASLAVTLGLPTPQFRLREFATKVAEALDGRTLVFIGRLDAVPSVAFLSEISELKDLLGKLPGRPALTVIIVYSGAWTAPFALNFDFTFGRPVETTFDKIGFHPWHAYLHLRLAWECAGNLELALDWEANSAIESLQHSPGDDGTFESILGQLADAAFRALQEPQRVAWLDFATNSKPLPLHGMGGLWQSQSGAARRVKPWLARALLRAGANGAARWRLRDCLCCQPLVTAILSRCFELESGLRTRHSHTLLRQANTLIDRTLEAHQQFLDGRNPTLAYPPNHPAPPNGPEDVWLFASLGEVVKALRGHLPLSTTRSCQELTRLRNGLAHGHHPGWAQLEVIRGFDPRAFQ